MATVIITSMRVKPVALRMMPPFIQRACYGSVDAGSNSARPAAVIAHQAARRGATLR